MVKFTDDQLTAVQADGGNMLVSASAGSGKTHVIISRILRLIAERRAGLDGILAVTFTSAAADEMKEKLRLALIEEYNRTGDTLLKDQLRMIGAAQISTIHSFCANLLRTYFSDGDYEPNFAILDDNQSILLKNEAIDELFDKNYRENDQDFLTAVSEFIRFRRDASLKKIIIELYGKTSVFYDGGAKRFDQSLYTVDGFNRILLSITSLQKEKLTLLFNDLCRLKEEFLSLGNTLRADYTDSLCRFAQIKLGEDAFEGYFDINQTSIGNIPPLKAAEKDDPALCILHSKLKDIKQDLTKLLKDEREFISGFDFDGELKAFLASGEAAKRLQKLLDGFTLFYKKNKRRENALDYDDLQSLTIELLKDQSVLSSVRQKYQYIFIDEYQDINELQETLLNVLSKDNLFMVGDLKQSIYSFRGCDPCFFADKYEKYFAGGGLAVRLNQNFRSASGVIEGVNRVFDNIMTVETAGVDYKSQSRLTSGKLYPDGLGKTEILTVYKDKEPREFDGRVYDLTRDMGSGVKSVPHSEGRAIAKIICNECGKQYYDIKSGGFKDVSFSDIVVLSASRTGFKDIAKELKAAGIPVTSDADDDIKDYPEIRFLINLLELIDNMQQDIPLVSVLKSPIGGFSESELADIRLSSSGEFFHQCYSGYCQANDDALANKIRAVNAYIKNIRLLSDFLCAGELLSKVITEKGVDLKYLAQKDGLDALNRIDRFLKASQPGGKKLSCGEFLKRLKSPGLKIPLPLSAAENAVRLMTIHKSKGLEFPIVILAGCSAAFNIRDEIETVLFDKELGVATKYYDPQKMTVKDTVLRQLIKSRMRFKLSQDKMRLLYVAMTRAKYSLYMVSSSSPAPYSYSYAVKTALNFSDFLSGSGIASYESGDLDEPAAEGALSPKNIVIGKADEEFTLALKSRLYAEYPYQSSITLPVKTNVSALLDTQRDEYLRVSLFGETGAEKGTAYHAFLQYADLSEGKDALTTLNDMLSCGLLTEEQYALIDAKKAQRILDMPVFMSLRGKKLLKEQEFIIEVPANLLYGGADGETVLLQGVIDLLAIDGEGVEIFDYKLSAIKSDGDLKEKYMRQLELYAFAASKILSLPVKSLKIINILSERVISCL